MTSEILIRYLRFTELFIRTRIKGVLRYVLGDIHFKPITAPQKFTLDVGCGGGGKGDVNLDLYFGKTDHHVGNIQPRNIPNFVNGDAQQLPFRDNVFKVTRCCHVLEHMENPLRALKEMKRVSRELSLIYVPSPLTHDKVTTHIFTWSEWTLNNLLKRAYKTVKVVHTPYEIIGIGIVPSIPMTMKLTRARKSSPETDDYASLQSELPVTIIE